MNAAVEANKCQILACYFSSSMRYEVQKLNIGIYPNAIKLKCMVTASFIIKSNLTSVEEERSDGTGSESCDGNVPEAETAEQIEGKKTAWLEVKVGVYQGSVLSPLLFAIVMHSLTDHLNKDMREFLYADDLAILGNGWEDVSQKYAKWKEKI